MTHVEGGGVPAGTQLNGIYEIDQRIAKGGMGEVYIGHVVQTGDKVAIKMILPEHASNELILDLFRKEASTLHNLYHEAIVRYYVFSVDPALNRPYLAMEYAEGPALGDRIRHSPLSQGEMAVLLPRVAGGLHAAHRAGIIHRDMSPDNIILVGGDVNRAKIIDFGIAKSSASEGTLIGSGFAGKLKYVSPEQLGLATGEVTAQSDIYSLGLVLAEAVLGHPLPMGGSQAEVVEKRRTVPDISSLPDYIRPLIGWMLQPNPADRPASMEVVATWRPQQGDATILAPTMAPAQPMPPPQTAPPAGPGSAAPVHPRERYQQQVVEERAPRRRRGGLLRFLSILFSGAVVAGAGIALVIFNTTPPPGTGGTDPVLPGQGGGSGQASSGATGAPTTGPAQPTGTTTTAGGAGTPATGPAQQTGAGTTTETGTTTLADATPTAPVTPTELAPLAGGAPTGGRIAVNQPADSGTPGVPTGLTPGGLDAGTAPAAGTGLQPVSPSTGAPVVGAPPSGTPSLTQPSGGQDLSTPTVAGTDATGTPTHGQPGAPSLPGGGTVSGPSLSTTPVAGDQGDPADTLAEPKIPTSVPGELMPGGTTGTGLATAPTAGTSPEPGSGGGPSVPTGLTPGGLDAGTAAGTGLPPVSPSSGAPNIGAAPSGTPSLTQPTGGQDLSTPTVAGTDMSSTPTLGQPSGPSLPAGGTLSGPSLSTTPVAGDQGDPADTLAEPTVATASPGGLTAPSGPAGGTGVAAGGGLELPRTGNATPSQPAITAPSSPTEVASIPTSENQPPTIRDRAPDSLSAKQGEKLNIRLGSFFDEEGAASLELKIQGDVPNGLHIRMAEGGIAQIWGTPAEYGDYNIKVAAIDSAGLISASIQVRLRVEAPLTNRSVRDYILGYDGGECFLSRPMELQAGSALIEVFADKSRIQRVVQFDADFKTTQGFEANIRMRPITPEQCALVTVLDQVGPQAIDNSLIIHLTDHNISSGGSLTGKIVGGKDARLFLFDNMAGITDLTRFIETRNGEVGFGLPIAGNGPQILIAARPRSGSSLGSDASLNQLLGAAQRREASLALGFFIIE